MSPECTEMSHPTYHNQADNWILTLDVQFIKTYIKNI